MRANITGRVIKVPDVAEATSLGGTMLAGMAVGIYKDYQDAATKVYRAKKIFRPESSRSKRYNSCYQKIYKKLYPTLKELNAAINNDFPMMRN